MGNWKTDSLIREFARESARLVFQSFQTKKVKLEDIKIRDINPGIENTVKWLRERGFKTCDSGDGNTNLYECDISIPYVHMICNPNSLFIETKRLQYELNIIGIKVMPYSEDGKSPSIEASWNPCDEFATISLYNVTI